MKFTSLRQVFDHYYERLEDCIEDENPSEYANVADSLAHDVKKVYWEINDD